MFPNKFLQRAASLKFAKSTSVSTRALLAKFVLNFASNGCKWRVWQHRLCLLSEKLQSVHTPAVLAIRPYPKMASAISYMEIGGNRRLVCPKAKRTDAVNGGEAVHLDH